MSDTAVTTQPGMVRSAVLQGALRQLGKTLQGAGGVLLCGEPGSGRETFAREIHAAIFNGDPGARPFVVVDCSVTDDLEQRLFGCEPFEGGAGPNGLDRIAEGAGLHQASGGTLFLRHITQMPGSLQDRLARVLRDREAWLESREGPLRQDVIFRPIATTNKAELNGSVHPELQRRLAVVGVPPLRDRREDIPALVRSLLIESCLSANVPTKGITSQAIALLKALPWRGNIRELRSLLQTVSVTVPGQVIRLRDVLARVQLDGSAHSFIYGGSLREARERFEREYVAAVLQQHHGRVAEAAKALGIQRTNLYRKLRQLSVPRGRASIRLSPEEPQG